MRFTETAEFSENSMYIDRKLTRFKSNQSALGYLEFPVGAVA